LEKDSWLMLFCNLLYIILTMMEIDGGVSWKRFTVDWFCCLRSFIFMIHYFWNIVNSSHMEWYICIDSYDIYICWSKLTIHKGTTQLVICVVQIESRITQSRTKMLIIKSYLSFATLSTIPCWFDLKKQETIIFILNQTTLMISVLFLIDQRVHSCILSLNELSVST